MNYKKIFRTQKARRFVLKMFSFIPDKSMLTLQYYIKHGRVIDWRTPKRFTEKIQWYKLHYRDPRMKICVNKFLVRQYVQDKGLGNILVPLIAHYKKIEQLEWEKLPSSFVVKSQQGGGGLNVFVVHDKESITKDKIVQLLHCPIDKVKRKTSGREWAYGDIETGIVVEKELVNIDNPQAGINDYKFFCYNGEPKYVVVDVNRYIDHRRNFYDCKWNNLHIVSDCPAIDDEISKPENFDEMINIASILSKDFPYVRVDLYNISGVIYFGELTFYPWSGYVQFEPDAADYLFGEPFELTPFQ